MPSFRVYLPTPAAHDIKESYPEVPRLSSLQGARVAVLENGWDCMDTIFEFISSDLTQLGAAEVRLFSVPHSLPSPPALIEEIVEFADAAIAGLGNSGACCAWTLYDSISLERRGIPSGMMVTAELENIARSTLGAYGAENHRLVVLPSDTDFAPRETLREREIEAVRAVFGEEATKGLGS